MGALNNALVARFLSTTLPKGRHGEPKSFLVLLLSSLLVGACSSPAVNPPVTVVEATRLVQVTRVSKVTVPPVEVTRLSEVTVLVEVTRIVEQTAAPVEVTRIVEVSRLPPSATPKLPSTPTARLTVVAPGVSPDAIVAAFKAAGLEAEQARPMMKEDYGMAPMLGRGVRFIIPSLCPDCGGRVIVVENAEERARLVDFYKELGKQSALAFSWVFEKGALVVQLNGDLPEAQARKYEAVLP